ncbi:wax ester/triacylglycerol synthase family O-acyltransferase [Haloechinothrix sp. LS1_15]|uniref:WS/DGAT/MGAT family O-acyltransferase n=1 Tax=Haloechinothrix sp. LS1_15 TaxID=2652248 RepID=UPI00294646EF|nr:wax ester/triacylglycerol synthase family O-acyltransferase [Haloechinothrix sp. LS1_15]MDV6014677.1 wax ester/triacylglycerol synthase family O-acyltransferase [Haloechinothrix sp. LS1_15]
MRDGMEYLSALDAAFLEVEDADPHVSLAIGAVTVLDGPAPGQAELLSALGERLAAVPRFGQRVRRAPLDVIRPAWADDPEFDLSYHVRRAALPAPGDDATLCCFVARVMEQRLDRDHPLWECWIVEGLTGGHWAVVMKVHHCLADGIAGQRLYDFFADQGQVQESAPVISMPQCRARGLRHDIVDSVTSVVNLPLGVIRSLPDVISGAQRLVTGLVRPSTPTSLLGPIGRARRYSVARVSLDDAREIGAAFGATVNDVALAAVTRALRTLLINRGEHPPADAVRAMVPVSMRPGDAGRVLDNRLSIMTAHLPVEIADPVHRLNEVRARLNAVKSGHESEARASIITIAERAPSALISWLVRLIGRLPQRSIVTLATNVRGPDVPLSLFGRPIVEIWPIAPIALRLRIGVAMMSYHDRLTFGITADYRTAPETTLLSTEIESGIAELVQATRLVLRRPRGESHAPTGDIATG